MALVFDTGPLLALLDADDRDHRRCAAMAASVDEEFVVPTLVLLELDYWLRKRDVRQVWNEFAEDLAGGAYRLHHPDAHDIARAATLETQYASLDLGVVDASVIVTCERLGETKVATLNPRDFSVVRPRHCDALTLLPG